MLRVRTVLMRIRSGSLFSLWCGRGSDFFLFGSGNGSCSQSKWCQSATILVYRPSTAPILSLHASIARVYGPPWLYSNFEPPELLNCDFNSDPDPQNFGHLCFSLEDAKKDGHCLGPDLRAAQPQVHFQSLGYHTVSLSGIECCKLNLKKRPRVAVRPMDS